MVIVDKNIENSDNLQGGITMILKTGHLTRKDESKNILEPYIIRMIGMGELFEVEALQQRVYRDLKRKDVLVTDSYEAMAGDLEAGGQILGAYNGSGELIAYRFISFPKLGEHNLGRDLNLGTEMLTKVAHLETTVVHPFYRGNGLQSETLELAFPIIQGKGYRHVLCTVSPMNPHSLYNVMSNGLKIKALKRKYATDHEPNGLWRFVLHKDLEAKSQAKILDWAHVSMSDILFQEKLISEGFVGNWLLREQQQLQYIRLGV